jgi:Zn-dependent metalloprotease/subtilisin family serine protease
MIRKILPVAAITTLALSQTLFPLVSTAESTAEKPKIAVSSKFVEEISLSESVGSPNFISGKLTDSSKDSPEKIVYAFLNSAKHTYKLESDAKSLFKVLKQEKESLGHQVVRLQQVYKGIPIFGYRQIAHINKGVLQSFSGSVAPEAIIKASINGKKRISKDEAINLAKQDLKVNATFTKTPTADLNIYIKENKAHLVYLVRLNFLKPEPGNWYYFVDAVSGAIIDKFNAIEHARTTVKGTGVLGDTKTLQANKIKNSYYLQDYTRGLGIQTYDAQYEENLPGKLWVDPDGNLKDAYDAPAVDAHYYAGITYDYYKKIHNRDSFDNNGAPIKSTVHYGRQYNNAFWDGTQMVYGDGDGKEFRPLSGGIDVVGHEITHAVTEHTAGLIYRSESGAINESISDIFGTLIEFYNNQNPDWKIGEDVYTPDQPGDALRYMDDPTRAGDPDHYSKRYTGSDDNGGVHINSSIINKAAYLISEGGTHYGVKVQGIGKDKLGKIFYRALTQYLTPLSDFQQLRNAAIQSAKDLYGNTATEVKTVTDAFTAVGISGKPAESVIQTLQLGKPFTFEFKKAGEVKWFKIDPKSALAKNSHIKFSVSGDSDSYISVFRDETSADQGDTLPAYKNQINEIDFPLAWDGPLYVKVESKGIGVFTINNVPHYAQPTDPPEEECLAEISAEADHSVLGLLGSLRDIRDNLLQQTQKGKEIASLYYRISKEVADDAIIDSKFRSSVANDIEQLKGVIQELQKISNGENSSYKLTKQDAKVIQHLKDAVNKKVSKESSARLNEVWNSLQLEEGKSLSEAIKSVGLATDSSNEIIVKVKKGVSFNQLTKSVKKTMTALGIKETPQIKGLSNNVVKVENTYIFKVNNSPKKLVKQLKKLDIFEFVEENKTMHAFSADVQYQTQWSLENKGQTPYDGNPGKPGADIKFAEMEKFLSGKKLPDTIIAVVDTGVAYNLDDFAGKVLTNLDYDFVNNDADAMDDDGHGTHVAGIIGATSRNNISMTGINQSAKILPVKVLDADGTGSSTNVALGIRYAVDKGAKVINLSLGGDEFSSVIEDALKYAVSKGATIVAAAGNDGAGKLSYPASSEYVISVGATNNLDEIADFSNGGEGLDVVAPGERIPSLYPDGQVYYLDGTSMATPHVAAVAGLLYSIKPSIKFTNVLEVLQETSTDLGDAGYDPVYGWGRLDAAAAVKYLSSQAPSAPKVNPVTDRDTKVTGTAEAEAKITVKAGSAVLGEATAGKDGKFSVNIKAQRAGTVLLVTATDKAGNTSPATTVTVQDKTPPSAPKVNPVTDRDTKVTGTAEAEAKVTVKAGSIVLGVATAGKDGKFTVNIKAQRAGTVLLVTATDKANNTSAATKVTVQDKTPPNAPQVNPVTDRDTKVTGKTEANAKVVVKAGKNQLGEAKAGKDGRFSVKIKAQKAGTILEVVSIDASGNVSKATKMKVQKR